MLMKTVVVGTSYGGMNALKIVLSALPINFRAPMLIVQHLSPQSNGYLIEYLNNFSKIKVKEADEKEQIRIGNAYLAPPNYHLLVDNKGFLSLTVNEKINFARPSIDVLFESAVDAFGSEVIGVILTGANSDGSMGLKRIKDSGGIAIVQDPKEAEADTMPRAAIKITDVDYVLPLIEIANKLRQIVGDT